MIKFLETDEELNSVLSGYFLKLFNFIISDPEKCLAYLFQK